MAMLRKIITSHSAEWYDQEAKNFHRLWKSPWRVRHFRDSNFFHLTDKAAEGIYALEERKNRRIKLRMNNSFKKATVVRNNPWKLRPLKRRRMRISSQWVFRGFGSVNGIVF